MKNYPKNVDECSRHNLRMTKPSQGDIKLLLEFSSDPSFVVYSLILYSIVYILYIALHTSSKCNRGNHSLFWLQSTIASKKFK